MRLITAVAVAVGVLSTGAAAAQDKAQIEHGEKVYVAQAGRSGQESERDSKAAHEGICLTAEGGPRRPRGLHVQPEKVAGRHQWGYSSRGCCGTGSLRSAWP